MLHKVSQAERATHPREPGGAD